MRHKGDRAELDALLESAWESQQKRKKWAEMHPSTDPSKVSHMQQHGEPSWKKIVRWGALGLGTLSWGSGVAAMYGDDYKLAVCLYFVGILIVTIDFITLDAHSGYPRLKKVIMVSSTVFVATLAFALSVAWIGLRKSDVMRTITLTPPSADFVGSGINYFTIKNGTDKDAYSVALKFSFGVSPSYFEIGPRPGEARGLVPGQPGLRPTDTTGIACRTDQDTYNIYIFIYRLSAGESREFSLTYLKDNPVHVQTRVSHVEAKPMPWIHDQRGLSTALMFDEPCHPLGLFTYLQ